MAVIDLRSDTVTQPTDAMRRAMAWAEVGDDVFAEDPSAARLERRAAELLGKEAALFVPSGTMANQIALLVHCGRGEEVIVGEASHSLAYESGAGGAWAGVQFQVAGQGGLFDAAAMAAAIRPPHYYLPRSRLVMLENTHNAAGGRIFPQDDVVAIAREAHRAGLAVHIDGARIWNASVATGRPPHELAAPADSVSACFSKGLGAPVGSVLAGSRDFIAEAHRYRKMLGGGMRQVGILCAAAHHALEHHIDRLAEDHEHARLVARGLAGSAGLHCDVEAVQTNIVMCDLPGPDAPAFVERAAGAGVLLHAFGPRRIRLVTHLGIDRPAIDRAVQALQLVAGFF